MSTLTIVPNRLSILLDSKYEINLTESKETKTCGYATIPRKDLYEQICDVSKLSYLVYVRHDKLTGENHVIGQSEQLSLSK